MARVSMGDAWDDAQAIVRREAALLIPLALATMGTATMILSFAMPAAPATAAPAMPPAGPWMIALVPALLLILIANLSIAALALVPRISVGEALTGAVRRLPGAFVLGIVMTLATSVALSIATLVAAVVASVARLGSAGASSLLVLIVAPVLLFLFARFVTIWSQLAVDPPAIAPAATLRQGFALTRGHAAVIAGAMVAYLIGYFLVSLALQFALGSLFVMGGRVLGIEPAARLLATLIVAGAGAVMQMVLIVFQAALYRRLAALQR